MTSGPEDHLFQKRSVSLHGHKTSVSLEKAFWSVLEEAARAQNISLSQLIKNIDDTRQGNLASALRLYGLRYHTAGEVPPEEKWLLENKQALTSVKQGLQDSRDKKLIDRES